ncbi:hypothetical protein [Zymomonas mobilis]|uniref:hypothetical protein n=1 Tax=Zymomonas mobilis TaxID=542 RepID=UPI0009B6B825|nr:hypothetical protein [Zymomonas mobilis]
MMEINGNKVFDFLRRSKKSPNYKEYFLIGRKIYIFFQKNIKKGLHEKRFTHRSRFHGGRVAQW